MSSFSIFNQPQPPIKNAVPTPASSSSFALNSSQQQVNAPQNGCPSDQRQMTNYDVIGVLGVFLSINLLKNSLLYIYVLIFILETHIPNTVI